MYCYQKYYSLQFTVLKLLMNFDFPSTKKVYIVLSQEAIMGAFVIWIVSSHL